MSHRFKLLMLLILLLPIKVEAIIDEFLSPFTTVAVYPMTIGTLAASYMAINHEKTVDPAQQETVEDRPLGSYSKYGDLMGQLVPNAAYFLIEGGLGLITSNNEALTNASLMFSATAYASIVTTVLKYTVQEKRPNSEERNSFPSGHTTTAFAFASVVGMRHHFLWGALAYGMAGAVGYSRMNDNRHWLHDVIAGATIGISYGVGICSLKSNGKYAQSFYPIPLNDGMMLTYVVKI